jgi:hypothetical protein
VENRRYGVFRGLRSQPAGALGVGIVAAQVKNEEPATLGWVFMWICDFPILRFSNHEITKSRNIRTPGLAAGSTLFTRLAGADC